jgi:hypothetical protein
MGGLAWGLMFHGGTCQNFPMWEESPPFSILRILIEMENRQHCFMLMSRHFYDFLFLVYLARSNK